MPKIVLRCSAGTELPRGYQSVDALLAGELNLLPLPTEDGALVSRAPYEMGQAEFLACPYFEVLAEGDRGGGKTDVLLMDFTQHVGKGFGRAWRGLLLRRTYKELADVISKSQTWFPLLWPGATYNQTDHVWTWPTGETLRLGYAENDKDYWNYHGAEYPWIAWEELSNWATPAAYLKFMTLNRSSRPGMPRCYRSTTNPYGPGHSWIKKRWRLPGQRNHVILDPSGREQARVSIFVRLRNNRSLLDADPDYVRTLVTGATSPGLFKAWIEGSWDIVEGGMFEDVWSPRWNVVPTFTPPPSWYVDRAFDDGSSAPFAVGWFAESDGTDLQLPNGKVMTTVRGDVFMIREWYGAKESPVSGTWEGLKLDSAVISAGIIERELQWGLYGRVKPGPADSRIFSSEHGVSVAQDMAQPVTVGGQRYGGATFSAADKSPGSRVAGWKQLRAYLRNAWPSDRIREKPGLFICENGVHWQRTVPVLTRDHEKNPDDVKHPEDHIGDMTRYRIHNPPRRMIVRHLIGTN